MKDFKPEGALLNTLENQKYLQNASTLALAQTNGAILEAVVTMCDAEHNLIVKLGNMKGIIPRNEGAVGIAEGYTRDIALISRVGKPVSFVINEFKTDLNGSVFAMLSRRKAQQKCLDYILNNKFAGDIIDAKITHLEPFGAFCDVGCGNIALLPIDSISVSRISHPADRFLVGDNIKAIIKSIDENGKITLSHKELLGTWEENAASFSQGQTVSGIVRSIEEYGVFVELSPNLTGLAEPKSDVEVGQCASVYIKSMIPEKMKIKLIIIDSFDTQPENKSKYFYNEKHITDFFYSPACCSKQISTHF